MAKQFSKADIVNLIAIAVSVVGLILVVVGGQVLSYTTAIGFNFSHLHPVLFVGVAVTVVAMAVAIYGEVLCCKMQNNRIIGTVALYLGVIAVMFAILFVVWTIVWPVLFPVNG